MDKKYLPSVVILYLNYFIQGIGCSLLSQQVVKEMLAAQWGVGDVMTVTAVAAALGLGRLVSLPFAGPLSDKLERRISVLIGAASYVIFFIGIAFSPNIQVAYVAAGTSLSYAALPVADGIAIGILGVLAIFAPMLAGSFCQCEIRKSFSEDRTIKKRSLRV
ncbi:MFS transporter [Coprococcus catus]|nr:MFS transporter [Coprococcus catus]MBX9231782.1 MFS transporter [Coprococcus catus]MCT6800506.1 MFS transporter [Coprococcus catus]